MHLLKTFILSSLFFSAASHAGLTLNLGGGTAWTRGRVQNPGTLAPTLHAEIGANVKNKTAFGGFFIADYPVQPSSGAPAYPGHLGIVMRVFFGSNRPLWVDAKIDVIGFALALANSSSRSSSDDSFIKYINYGLSFGYRIGLGKLVSLLPYISYESFMFPSNYLFYYPQNRYYVPSTGLKISFEF